MNTYSNRFILESFVEKALGTYRSRASFHSGVINCRCSVCGDSESNKGKRRAYILKNNPKRDGEWIYYCHNDDCRANGGIKVSTWLKNWFPGLYHDYKREAFLLKKENKEYTTYKDNIVEEPEIYNESDDTKHFVPILKGSGRIFEKAKTYCIERKIPTAIWNTWYVSLGGRYEGRLIIPFLDKTGKIYYYQARTLIGQDPKYLNRKMENGEKGIYNIYHVDSSKEVMVVEGPIDSLFLDNSIATLGVKFTDKVKTELDKIRCYYILDNDAAGYKVAKKFLEDEKYVFNWKRFLKDEHITVPVKDVNDYILVSGKTHLSFEDLKKYFTNNVYDKVWF